jgi:hypothetical protein
MIGSGNATAVKSVVGRLLPGQARCWKDDVAPAELIFIVVGLLAYGCPLQAIVHVFGLDERTVAAWRDRAGQQCQRVQQAVVQQGQLTLTHVQADEIRVKGKKGIFADGPGNGSELTIMVGRGGADEPRSCVGGSPAAAGPPLCLWSQSAPDLCRWMGQLSQCHLAYLCPTDERRDPNRQTTGASLVTLADWTSDQDAEKTSPGFGEAYPLAWG